MKLNPTTPQFDNGRADVAKILSQILDRFGGEIVMRREKVEEPDGTRSIQTRLTVGNRSLAALTTELSVKKTRGDRLARDLEDQLCRFAHQLG